MRCCVPNCKNDSRHISKSQGITFHVFPTEASSRSSWLRAVGREGWKPKERSAVCSEHFLCNDLYETKSGLRKVRTGAVPIVVQDGQRCEFGERASLKVCRICLDVNEKLFPIRMYRLEQAYECLTGISMEENEQLPQKLCTECITRLITFKGFRSKSLRAHSLLMEILRKYNDLSLTTVKTINRECHQLTSTLIQKYYDSSHFDLHVDATDEVNVKIEKAGAIEEPMSIQQVNMDPMNIEVEVKRENLNDDDMFGERLDNGNVSRGNDMFGEVIDDGNRNDDVIGEAIDDGDVNRHDDVFDEPMDNDGAINDYEPQNDADSDPNYEDDVKDVIESDDEIIRIPKAMKKRKSEIKIKKLKARKVKKSVSEPKVDRRRRPFLNNDLNETLFSIANLSFDEQIAEIEKRQESTNYKNSTYKCRECFKGFLDEIAYKGHALRHTNHCGDFVCDICKTHFKHHHALRKHITAHHTQRFSCNSCPYVTTHRQTARLHERWHKGTKYQCPHCLDEFVKFTTYMGHIRIKHPSDFVCQLCGYSFVSEKGIELHKKLKHRLDNVVIPKDGPVCETCNVKFVSLEAHKRHLRVSGRHLDSNVKEPREVNARKTPKKSKDVKDRKPREKKEDDEARKMYPSQIRKAEGPIPCEQCGLQLEDSRAYHGHFRRMHPDKNRTKYPSMRSPCMCEICGRIFQSYALLKDHRFLHTGEKPFKCDECPKSFRMKQRLTAHKRVHAKVRSTYVCDVCNKGFSTHSNRQRHMFIHTGLKPFKCEMCGKGFKHASEKRAHITYVHLKKPWPKRQRGKRPKEYERQGQLEMEAHSAREMDAQPIWPTCSDPKMADMNVNPILDDKPLFYNLKI